MRAPGMRVGPLLVAVLFLAVLGGGIGYSVGTLTRSQHSGPATTGGGGGGTGTEPATGNSSSPATGASTAAAAHCLKHTEDLAKAGPLTQLLYLHTQYSEVWICKDGAGTLYYQGHSGPPGQDLQEHVNALYLTEVQREGANGYVATNRDDNGRVTEYHVTPTRLVKKFYNYASPKPDETENAV
jgi:hypothetical protein